MFRIALLLPLMPVIALAATTGPSHRGDIDDRQATPAESTRLAASKKNEPAITGVLDATAHGEVPKDAAIRIRQPDASPLSTDLARQFAAELSTRGYRSGRGSDHYVLEFRLSSDSIDPDPSARLRFEDNSLMLRMWLRERPAKRTVIRLRLIIVEVTAPDGELVWIARASTIRAPVDPYELAALLIPALTEQLGETVYGQKVQ